MKSTLSIFVAASTLALLTACGGGGGDGSPASKDVAITSTNQTAVTRASFNGGAAVGLAQDSVSGGGTAGPMSAGAAVRRAMAALPGRRSSIASVGAHPAALTTGTDACQVSGTTTVSVDDRDGNGMLSSGDVLTATFTQCRDSATSSINGSVTITLTATPTADNLDASANFQGLAVVDGDVSTGLSGIISLHEVDGVTLNTLQLTVGTGGLTATIASPTYNDSFAFESGTLIETDQTTSQTLETVKGSFTASSIGGRITVSTPVPLATASGAVYPSSGQLKIVGASGSTVLATVLDATQVQLQLDANGDGTYESSSVVAWTTLLP